MRSCLCLKISHAHRPPTADDNIEFEEPLTSLPQPQRLRALQLFLAKLQLYQTTLSQSHTHRKLEQPSQDVDSHDGLQAYSSISYNSSMSLGAPVSLPPLSAPMSASAVLETQTQTVATPHTHSAASQLAPSRLGGSSNRSHSPITQFRSTNKRPSPLRAYSHTRSQGLGKKLSKSKSAAGALGPVHSSTASL